MSYINKEWVTSEIKKMKAHNEERYYVLGVVATELEPFDTKMINKRIITHLKDKLPRYSISDINVGYSEKKEFKIWGNGIDYNDRIFIRIGDFSSSGRLWYSKIKEHLIDRQVEIRKFILKMEKTLQDLDLLSRQYDEGVDKLKEIENEMGSSNKLLKFFPLANQLHRA